MKSRSAHHRLQSGVTLVELLIVIVITSVLAAIAIPSYRRMVVSSKVSTMVSDLHSSLLLARSEALKRSVSIGICKTTNPSDTTPTCNSAEDTLGWATGWMIYVDTNGNKSRDTNDAIVQVFGPYLNSASEGSITSDAANETVTFGITGQTFVKTQFVINAPSAYSSETRAVCLSIGGRAKVEQANACP
ncbi:GspH/FimT family pseudopilin [Undibacterium cyanobacteriorum]|uniref:Type II secretion system protein H n=1 Tax=Undibacterium cyanobacteriorum TaxID=3073561 RepID=A0ABY9RGI2_9BURK|nr:GspH/FimT family pseudopilin [Undibacterium sp. 20NA77.5]WMW79779.1 GspH/FimT family pseudopilin [Undibacterium sp. 20NA77.5]